MNGTSSAVAIPESVTQEQTLTAAWFHHLADVSPAQTWFANIDNHRPAAPIKAIYRNS